MARQEAPGRRVDPAGLHKVTKIIDANTIEIDTGLNVRFLGVQINQKAETMDYLRRRILGKNVMIKDEQVMDHNMVSAYVYLKNKIFVNSYLIKVGFGSPDLSIDHRLRDKFITLQNGTAEGDKSQNLRLMSNN